MYQHVRHTMEQYHHVLNIPSLDQNPRDMYLNLPISQCCRSVYIYQYITTLSPHPPPFLGHDMSVKETSLVTTHAWANCACGTFAHASKLQSIPSVLRICLFNVPPAFNCSSSYKGLSRRLLPNPNRLSKTASSARRNTA